MHSVIDVSSPDLSALISIDYFIDVIDNIQTINCNIPGKAFPSWLQLHKFTLSSVKKEGSYMLLFNEINCSKNMDTSLFIDQVYRSIMNLEHYKTV